MPKMAPFVHHLCLEEGAVQLFAKAHGVDPGQQKLSPLARKPKAQKAPNTEGSCHKACSRTKHPRALDPIRPGSHQTKWLRQLPATPAAVTETGAAAAAILCHRLLLYYSISTTTTTTATATATATTTTATTTTTTYYFYFYYC